MVPGRRVPEEARRAYRFDRLASILAGLYMGSIFPFAGVLAREQLHASAFVLALMTAAPFIGNLFALFWAQAMEGRPKLPFVKWSHLAARATFLLAPFATTPLRFALIMSAAQILGTIATPAYAAVIKEVYPDNQRGRIMSYTRAALLMASVLTTFLIGPLLKVVSYRYVFPVTCLFGLAAALVFGRIPVPGPAQPLNAEGAEEAAGRAPRRGSGEAFRATLGFLGSTMRIFHTDRGYRWFALSVFTYGFGNLMIVPVIPFIQVDRLHISTNHIALLANLAQIVAAVSYFYWGRYVDRHSPLKAVVVNILLNALIPVFYLIATSKWMLVPAFCLAGITQAGIDLAYFNSILSFANEENASRYQALHSFLLGIRGVIAPLIGGFMFYVLRENGLDLRWLFLVGLTLILAGCWMQLMGLRRRTRELAKQRVAYS
jgi:MFS family permease